MSQSIASWKTTLIADLLAYKGMELVDQWLALDDPIDILTSVGSLEQHIADIKSKDKKVVLTTPNLIKELNALNKDDTVKHIADEALNKIKAMDEAKKAQRKQRNPRRVENPKKPYKRCPGDTMTILRKREIAPR